MDYTPDQTLIDLTEQLIKAGSEFDLETLDKLYAEELKIIKLDDDGQLSMMDKEDNMAIFRKLKESGAAPLSKDTTIHYSERRGDIGYVFLTRKMNLTGKSEELRFHIQWKKLEGEWKVVYENIVARPASE